MYFIISLNNPSDKFLKVSVFFLFIISFNKQFLLFQLPAFFWWTERNSETLLLPCWLAASFGVSFSRPFKRTLALIGLASSTRYLQISKYPFLAAI